MVKITVLFLVILSSVIAKKDLLEELSNSIEDFTLDNSDELRNNLSENRDVCYECVTIFRNVLDKRRSGAGKEAMKAFFFKLCKTVNKWTDAVCNGYIDIEIDNALFIMDHKKDLKPERICAILMQEYKCKDPEAVKWAVKIPPKNSKVVSRKTDKPIKVLHLTDFHYDPEYVPGTDADCGLGLCCQNGKNSDLSKNAGYWADYHFCDTPLHSILNILERLKHEANIDFVYFTGDIISHKSWATSVESNSKSIRKIYSLLKSYFKNIPVLPILGNHESHPTDFFSPDCTIVGNISTQWVFDVASEEWPQWMDDSIKPTVRKGGYYTFLLRPGLRIIGLNSNVCYIFNPWLIYDDVDPFNQLQWLVDTLYEAEKNGESVHILSHVPPGDQSCHLRWSYEFARIINRFSQTIKAQFNGHTHLDELRIFFNPSNSSEIINVAFNGGSFTTFVGFNPNYRIYKINSNLMVEDYDHFTYNLTKANLDPTNSPDWFKLYSFKKVYDLDDLSFRSFEVLLEKFRNNRSLLQLYYKLSNRNSDVMKPCGDNCLDSLLCAMTTVESEKSLNC